MLLSHKRFQCTQFDPKLRLLSLDSSYLLKTYNMSTGCEKLPLDGAMWWTGIPPIVYSCHASSVRWTGTQNLDKALTEDE